MNDRYNTDHSSEGEHSRGKQNEIELLQDFAQNTTMHGLHSVANSKTKLSKVIWLTLLSLSLFYMVKSTILSGKRYFSYPYTTEVGEEFAGKSGLKFPAITLCPMNMFVKTKIELQDEHRLFRKMGLNLKICDGTRKSRQRYNLSCGMFLMCNVGFYDMGGSNCGPETKTVLDDYLRNANNSSVINYEEQFRDIYGPNLEHSLEDCRFINRKCSASDFTKHVYTYGKCFQINNDKQNASWTFAYDKLFIVLDAKVRQYTKSPLFTEGFKFYVQAQGTFTSPRKGFVVSPGTIANVMVKQTKKTYLKHPYKSNCTERGLKSYSTYTILGCMNECFEDLKVKVCGCRSCGYFQHNSQIRVCTTNDLKCEQEIRIQFNPKTCDCPPPCSETTYDYQLSYSTFPDVRSTTMLEKHRKLSIVYQRQNLVAIMIHFEAASYLTQDEKESYTWEALLGEVGGNLGLMVGCSVLTAAEILHLIALLIYKGFQRFGAKQRKVNLSKECEQPTM